MVSITSGFFPPGQSRQSLDPRSGRVAKEFSLLRRADEHVGTLSGVAKQLGGERLTLPPDAAQISGRVLGVAKPIHRRLTDVPVQRLETRIDIVAKEAGVHEESAVG